MGHQVVALEAAHAKSDPDRVARDNPVQHRKRLLALEALETVSQGELAAEAEQSGRNHQSNQDQRSEDSHQPLGIAATPLLGTWPWRIGCVSSGPRLRGPF